jgi:hypothetical protein
MYFARQPKPSDLHLQFRPVKMAVELKYSSFCLFNKQFMEFLNFYAHIKKQNFYIKRKKMIQAVAVVTTLLDAKK